MAARGAAQQFLSRAALGSDGILSPNESFTFGFDVGLAAPGSSNLTVDANGEPYDWTFNATPKPTYDANNASFVFGVRADNPLYLPLVAGKDQLRCRLRMIFQSMEAKDYGRTERKRDSSV
ncbi:MAG: hypothetical protein U0350_44370 [Caldilineaceae bacterium]